MRAIVFREGRHVSLEELPDPEPGSGEVVIAVKASGICHTDIEILRGNYGSSAFPLVPGHEFAGEIVSVGQDVSGLSVGDRVVVDPNLGCGTCPACRRRQINLCERLGAYGVTRNGGFAEFCVVAADHVHPIGHMDWQVAALAEPLACVLNGLSTIRERSCDAAMVFGAGPIGLLMALALKWRGTRQVTVVDLSEERLRLAETLGLHAVAAGSSRLPAIRRSQDFVAHATGVPDVAEAMLEYVRDGGAALFFGVCPQDAQIRVSPFEMFRRQLSLFGTHSLNANISEALPLLQDHEAEAARLISHRVGLKEIKAILTGGPAPGALKVQLEA
jgi:2-desacetyl-2-hydroxyethyl bacteriochlorophyllide A dehydrogenase